MQNIEIKARCHDLSAAEQAAVAAGAVYRTTLRQKDTYFRIDSGRLKIREIRDGESQLIFYSRVDSAGPRTSDYHIVMVDNEPELKELLSRALSVSVVVEKIRKLYLYDEVRIHMDSVVQLGDFIELEGVLEPEKEHDVVRAKVDSLIKALRIDTEDLVPFSYSDLLLANHLR